MPLEDYLNYKQKSVSDKKPEGKIFTTIYSSESYYHSDLNPFFLLTLILKLSLVIAHKIFLINYLDRSKGRNVGIQFTLIHLADIIHIAEDRGSMTKGCQSKNTNSLDFVCHD